MFVCVTNLNICLWKWFYTKIIFKVFLGERYLKQDEQEIIDPKGSIWEGTFVRNKPDMWRWESGKFSGRWGSGKFRGSETQRYEACRNQLPENTQ